MAAAAGAGSATEEAHGDAAFAHAGFATKIIHVGQAPDAQTGAVAPPISLATTYAQLTPGLATGRDMAYSYGKGFEYQRTNNPTRAAFEMAIAAAEGGKHSISFASGMAATAAILHLLKSGDRIIAMDDMYGGTHRYMIRTAAPTYGMKFEFVDLTDPAKLEAALAAEPAKLVWLETPTNPTLKISDISAIAKICKAHGALLAVDNTFMSPHFQQPLALGADLSMSSVTKYINGHSDVVMGVVTTASDKICDDLRFIQNGVGAVAGPHACYLALRGLKTLHVRMDRHAQNAMAVAKLLEAHDFVKKVAYPGLESHPQHELAKAQMSGFGGMITFYIEGGLEGAQHFLEQLKVFVLAESLGAVESLAECPAIMTHASVPAEHRAKLGLTDDLIRLSVGIETEADLLADVLDALNKAKEYTGKVPTKAAKAAAAGGGGGL